MYTREFFEIAPGNRQRTTGHAAALAESFPFDDTHPTDWFYATMEEAAKQGWIHGDQNCFVCIHATHVLKGISRAEAVVLLSRALPVPKKPEKRLHLLMPILLPGMPMASAPLPINASSAMQSRLQCARMIRSCARRWLCFLPCDAQAKVWIWIAE
jgi:hypothetical protein